jgi:hypothetical protein
LSFVGIGNLLCVSARFCRTRLADLGGTALPGSSADLGRLIADETGKWGKVIRAANIRVE